MMEKINEPIHVDISFDPSKKSPILQSVVWRNRKYEIKHLGLYHRYKRGADLFHVFNVSSDTIHFKLIFDSSTLKWMLEEIYEPAF